MVCTINFICNAMVGIQMGKETPDRGCNKNCRRGTYFTNSHHQKWWLVSVSEVSCECSCNTGSCLVSSTGQNPPLPLPLPSPFCS